MHRRLHTDCRCSAAARPSRQVEVSAERTFSRSRTTSKRVSLPRSSTHYWPGPFAPRALPRFLTTMSRSDSRHGHHRQVIFSPPQLDVRTRHARPGLPGSSADLYARAVPSHPGKPDGCMCSLLHHRCLASPSPEGWPLPSLCNEAQPGSLSLRLTRSLTGASPAESLRPTPGSVPVERAIDRVTSFQITRSTRLGLAHRSSTEKGHGTHQSRQAWRLSHMGRGRAPPYCPKRDWPVRPARVARYCPVPSTCRDCNRCCSIHCWTPRQYREPSANRDRTCRRAVVVSRALR